MRLYGYSEIPNVTQYLHLGYISAALIEARKDMRESQFIKGGLSAIVIGIAISLIARQRSRVLFRIGVFISVVGVFCLFIALFLNSRPRSQATHMDGAIVRVTGTMSYKIDKHVKSGNTIPSDMPAMKKE